MNVKLDSGDGRSSSCTATNLRRTDFFHTTWISLKPVPWPQDHHEEVDEMGTARSVGINVPTARCLIHTIPSAEILDISPTLSVSCYVDLSMMHLTTRDDISNEMEPSTVLISYALFMINQTYNVCVLACSKNVCLSCPSMTTFLGRQPSHLRGFDRFVWIVAFIYRKSTTSFFAASLPLQ